MDAKKIFLQFKKGGVAESDRAVKNVGEKKFSLSKETSTLYVEPTDAFFDGENGDLIVKAPIDKYVSKEIANNPDFFGKETDFTEARSLTEMMDDNERNLYGKTAHEMDLPELLATFPEMVQDIVAIATPLEKLGDTDK